jgi:hypothetical protein
MSNPCFVFKLAQAKRNKRMASKKVIAGSFNQSKNDYFLSFSLGVSLTKPEGFCH